MNHADWMYEQSKVRHRRNGCNLPAVCWCSESDTGGRTRTPFEAGLLRQGFIFSAGTSSYFFAGAKITRLRHARQPLTYHRTKESAQRAAALYKTLPTDGYGMPGPAWWSDSDGAVDV